MALKARETEDELQFTVRNIGDGKQVRLDGLAEEISGMPFFSRLEVGKKLQQRRVVSPPCL